MQTASYWEYSQSTGVLRYAGEKVATGYSGAGESKNKPAAENLVAKGPIPKGEYKIESPRTSAKTGPYVLPLTPVGHNALGRSAFQIHGDSVSKPGTASSGCIIMPRAIREKIWNNGVTKLIVVQ